MELCRYSFCGAFHAWKQSQTILTQPVLQVRRKVGNAFFCRKHRKQLYSPRCTGLTEAQNIDTPASNYVPPVSSLARRMAEAKDNSRRTVSASSGVETSSPCSSNGFEVAQTDLDTTCVVQDLEVRDAPHTWDLSAGQVMERIRIFLQQASVPVESRDQLDEDITRLLAAVRGWIAQLADPVRHLLTSKIIDPQQKQDLQCIDALVTLLHMAGFAVLPELPEVAEPPNSNALSLGNSVERTLDPTILQGSRAVEEHVRRNGVRLRSPSYYPYLFIATRGSTVVQDSGLLLPQKIRAIERSGLSWITSPISLLLKNPFLKILKARGMGFDRRSSNETSEASTPSYHDEAPTDDYSSLPPSSNHRTIVRRVVPAMKLTRSWDSVHKLFRPAFTQEPAHKLVVLMYREVIPDKATISREQRKALINQIKESLSQAINPIPPGRKKAAQAAIDSQAFVFDGFKKPIGEAKPVSLMMFANVPWGTSHHLFPSTFVLPATRDLLRIDALTLSGLVSALVTYLRNAENTFVYVSLMASLVSYCARVMLGLRQALISYKEKIATQKVESLMAQHRGCVDSLAELAVEEMFVDAACVWLSGRLSNQLTARQLQQSIFQSVSLTDETVELWDDWLRRNGF